MRPPCLPPAACLLLSLWCTAWAADYAVVVNPASPLTGLSIGGLAQILKAEKQTWDTGGKILLVMPKEGTREEAVLLDRIYRTDGDGLKKFWTTMIYQNKITSAPKTAISKAALKLVELKIDAITVINAAEIPSGSPLKTLTIDGKRPGENGYPLSD
jgi:hypothetical protein